MMVNNLKTEPLASTKSVRQQAILKLSDRYAEEFPKWLPKKSYFQEEDLRYLQFLIPEGAKVLDLGCGLGDKLAALKPSRGIGVDFSQKIIEVAKSRNKGSNLEFLVGDIEDPNFISTLEGPFDIILLSD